MWMWFWIVAGALLVLLLAGAWVWDRRHTLDRDRLPDNRNDRPTPTSGASGSSY